MKKLWLVVITSFIFAFIVGCQMNTAKATLTLEVDEVEIHVGDDYEIEAVLENSTADITYEVIEGVDLVSLEGNIVTALGEGTVVIEVGVDGFSSLKAELYINILPEQPDHSNVIILPVTSVELEVGESHSIVAYTESGIELSYMIKEGEDFVSLEDNVVTALNPGTATIIVDIPTVSTNLYTKEFTVVVKEPVVVELPELEVQNKSIEITSEQEQVEIIAAVTNVEAAIKYEIIEGDDIIQLDNNKVMAKSNLSGSAVVRVSVEGYPDIYVDVNVVVNILLVVDETAPEMFLNPGTSHELKLNWGKEPTVGFLMEGINAIDDVDGDITNEVEISHSINNRKYGTYEVVYTATDKAGNEATLTRTVEVVWDYAVQFIGHQGSYYGVANSEEAFLYAAEVLQYQALETDLKQTKDGVFVCCHDDTFGGVTISSVTWDELKDIEVTSKRNAGYPTQNGEMPGTGVYTSKICTLERYLEICKEYGITAVIELKGSAGISNSDQSRMPQLMAAIEAEDMLEQTIFLASAYNCLIWVKQNGYDYIPCQYLVDSFASETVFNRCVTYGLDISGCVTYGNGETQNTAEWVAKYQDAGIKVSTYTFTQYSSYADVQKWIDIGVDFVTVDWHSMHKLNLPDNSDIVYHTVKFYDRDNNLLKETKVRSGRAAAAPSVPQIEGYEFTGWSGSIEDVTSDLEVTAEYELINYEITYDSNLYVLTKSSWASREEFANDFYNDLFDWVTANYTKLPAVSYSNGVYTIKVNSTEYGSATFSSPQDIKDLYVYTFERTFATLIYKPISGSNSADYVPEIDENYFLNTEPYRSKYIECNAYFLKVMQTSYSSYSQTYQQASNNRVQIFFRFHQWCNGSSISAFNDYPDKYIVKYLLGVDVTMPTEHTTYTINDEFVLPEPVSSIEFLGWYLDRDATGDPVESISKGSTGNLIIYAKWEEVEMPDVYSNITYELDGGTNSESNSSTYLEGVSTLLYPAEKAGYVFLGWSKEQGSNSYITSISELTSGDITLYANYDYAVYSISYDIQGGSWGSEAEFTGSAATSISSSANSNFWGGAYATDIYLNTVASHPKATWSFRVGMAYSDVMGIYTVVSIADSGKSFDETGVEYVLTISSSYNNYNGTSAFRSAVKVGQGVKITGDLSTGVATLEFYDESSISGGTIANFVDEYTIATLPVLLPAPQMEGKTFKGWSLNSDLSGEIITSLPSGTIGNITLYAIFQ